MKSRFKEDYGINW